MNLTTILLATVLATQPEKSFLDIKMEEQEKSIMAKALTIEKSIENFDHALYLVNDEIYEGNKMEFAKYYNCFLTVMNDKKETETRREGAQAGLVKLLTVVNMDYHAHLNPSPLIKTKISDNDVIRSNASNYVLLVYEKLNE